MQKKTMRFAAFAVFAQLIVWGATGQAFAQEKTSPYPTMAPLAQYLIADSASEIALARSAAPASISGGAEVLVLGRDGYTTAATGGNGFVCFVQRSWANSTDAAGFWDPKMSAPICLNPPAVRTFLPILRLKTKLVLAGESRAEIGHAVRAAFDKKELPALEPGAMSYMLSKEQRLGDLDEPWHPHVMWFVSGVSEKDWGANAPGSPILAADDPEDRMTIFMVPVAKWSDGTPATH